MEFWKTGTNQLLIGIVSGAFTIAMIAIALKNASGMSKIISSAAQGFSGVLTSASNAGGNGLNGGM